MKREKIEEKIESLELEKTVAGYSERAYENGCKYDSLPEVQLLNELKDKFRKFAELLKDK